MTPLQRAFPIVSRHGLGIRINVEGDGSHFNGDATFALADPLLEVDLDITGGKITKAVLRLKGSAGLASASRHRPIAGCKATSTSSSQVCQPT